MIAKIKKITTNIKSHIPAVIVGILCLVLLHVTSRTICIFRSVSGLPCPGCGLTRASVALLKGHVKEAFDFHPLVFVALAFIFAYIFTCVFKIKIIEKIKKKFINIFMLFLLIIFIGVYIARMIMFFPNEEPMTYLGTSVLGRIIDLVKSIF